MRPNFFACFAMVIMGAGCLMSPDIPPYDPCPSPVVFNDPDGHGGDASAGAGGAGGAGGNGGGAAPECINDEDCAGVLDAPDPKCGALRCTAEQKCVLEVMEGPIASQRYGDCKQGYCDGAGHLLQIDDNDDYFNDSNPCTIDFCQSDVSVNLILADGTPCPGLGNGYCYEGQCVECVDTDPGATCNAPGYVCSLIWCVNFLQCQNGQCGGPCAPCPAGVGCQQDADCISQVCNAGMCAIPSCLDLAVNDGETGIDCGGPNCPKCVDGSGCAQHSDCGSNVCMFGICQNPTCLDGVQNGDEGGMDCGGSGCPTCPELP